jgi:hypothetical protein
MKIRLGMQTVTAIDDGGIVLSLLTPKHITKIPPCLSLEVRSHFPQH